MTASFKQVFFDNKFTDISEAHLPINTTAIQYGLGVFGGIRAYYNKDEDKFCLFRINDHYSRFQSSIKVLGCDFNYSHEQLIEINIELLKRNKPNSNVYFRPFAYSNSQILGPNLSKVTLAYALYMIPLEEYMPMENGLSLMVSSWRRVSDNAIPSRGKFSSAYMNSALARKEANDSGFDEAILLSEAGNVCEGSAENIFVVRDGVLITPCPSDDILEGITRRTIIQIAKDMGIPVEVRTLDRSELYIADELFLSGTGCQIAWANSVDRRIIGDGKMGKITSQLKDKYFNIVYGKDQQYKDWCTKVTV